MPDPDDHRRDTRDAGGADFAALQDALSGIDRFAGIAVADLEPMHAKGLMHAHVRIRGTGAILRIPRIGAFGLGPADNLAYQAESFRRAAPSGHVPHLHAAIAPRTGIPWGALVISEIDGRLPRLPGDMPAIAEALAALHVLPVPEARAPLPSHDDPVAGTLEVIERQAAYLDAAGVAADARRQLDAELGWARDYAASVAGRGGPVTLVGTDTHPANFMIREGGGATVGEAVFVDLEKMLYGAPAIDLAHASVYTSTMWDEDIATALAPDEVAAFYAHYFACVPDSLADRIRPWCMPLRRLTWLRTTTWAAKWKVDSQDGAAWSAAQHDTAYIARVRARVADYFDPATISRIREELEAASSGL